MRYYLNIGITGKLTATDQHTGRVTVINTVDEYNVYFQTQAAYTGIAIEDLRIMASSSLDFPDEYTSDAKVIALCDAIRG
jgi:hypothetical protein